MSKPAKSGEEVFDAYFLTVYGERWLEIKKSLFDEDTKIARKNLFFTESFENEKLGLGNFFPDLDDCFEINGEFDLGQIDSKLLPFYRMDPASVVAARALIIDPGDRVLDMCAAPGGKSLVLIESLTGAKSGDWDLSGEFFANEFSSKRKFRMMSVFKRYLPKEVRSIVKIKGQDGSLFGLNRPEFFHKVLVDAPCSGERGVVKKKSDLALWKEKRTKSFGIRQYALLASAFDALLPGGQIVYSTCSISPHENDEVLRKLGKRKKDQFEIIENSDPGFEKTEFGQQALPDKSGWGPIYFSSIRKF